MSSRTRQVSIYGYSKSKAAASQCICEPTIAPDTSLSLLLNVLAQLKTTIAAFYPMSSTVAPIMGNMRMTATVNFIIISRLLWIEQSKQYNNGEKFNLTFARHRNQLKLIYDEAGRDWNTDPVSKYRPRDANLGEF